MAKDEKQTYTIGGATVEVQPSQSGRSPMAASLHITAGDERHAQHVGTIISRQLDAYNWRGQTSNPAGNPLIYSISAPDPLGDSGELPSKRPDLTWENLNMALRQLQRSIPTQDRMDAIAARQHAVRETTRNLRTRVRNLERARDVTAPLAAAAEEFFREQKGVELTFEERTQLQKALTKAYQQQSHGRG